MTIGKDLQTNLQDAVGVAIGKSGERHAQVLTRSQQKLYDMEAETGDLQKEKRELEEIIKSTENNIRKMQELLDSYKKTLEEVSKTVKANLSAVDSLRKDGVILPD